MTKVGPKVAAGLAPLLVPLDSVRPDPANARLHPTPNMDALKRSLKHYGQRKPIVVNTRTGIIEAGNGLWAAAKELGWQQIAAVQVDDGPDLATGYALMDNQSALLAEWDLPALKDALEGLDTGAFDMDLTGFDAKAIEDLMTQFHMPQEGLTDDDDVPEEPEEPYVKLGDLWQCGEHRVMCGDSTKAEDIARLSGRGQSVLVVQTVFADPPYGLNYSGGRSQVVRRKTYGHITGDAEQDNSHFVRVALAIGAQDYWICVSPINLGPTLAAMDHVDAVVIWDKGRPGLGYQWIRRQCEFIVFCTTREKTKNESSEFDLWSVPTDDPKSYEHGAQKPVALVERAFRFSPGENIADPFLGSGTTLIAAEKLRRICYGMEIEPRYVRVAIERWQNYTGRKAVLLK